MKQKGDGNTYSEEKNDDVYNSFLQLIGTGKSVCELFREVANNIPAKKYYCTVDRCLDVIRKIDKGIPLNMNIHRERMYRNIYSRVQLAKGVGEDIRTVVKRIINSPAPEYYISPRQVQYVVYSHRKRK